MTNRRRGHGEGSIYKRKDGLWCGSIDLERDISGKRRRKAIYGKTKKEVREKITKLQAQSLEGRLIEPSKLTISQFIAEWLENTSRPTIKLNTYTSYESTIRHHIHPHIGATRLSKLTPRKIQYLYSKLEKNGCSPRMRELVHSILHKALDQALKWDLIVRNPCDAVKRPVVPKKEMRCLTEQEVNTFLEHAREDRLYCLYLLALTTGMRQGELLGLQWIDVDLKHGSIHVCRNLMEVKGKHYLGSPKSAKGIRNIALPKSATSVLIEHGKRMLSEGFRKGYVFCDTKGGPLRKSNLQRNSFKPLLKRASLPDIRFHDLRHTAASLLLLQNVHPKVVQERLGHANISLTLNTYSHILPSMQQTAVDKIDGLLTELGTEFGYKKATN